MAGVTSQDQDMKFDFREFVKKTVRTNDYRRLAEIGVWRGELSRVLWSMKSTEYLLLVDPFDAAATGMTELVTQKQIDAMHDDLMKEKPETTKIMRMPSIEAAKKVPDASLDFVFIDARHTYQAVSGDICAWWPKIRRGGMIAGDDYGERFPGVALAVREYFPTHIHVNRVWLCSL